MLYVLISLFYLLFVVLDVNVKIYFGDSGCCMWMDCVKFGIEICKLLLECCLMLWLFILFIVRGKNWQDYDMDIIVNDVCFFNFEFNECWYGFEGYN